MYECFSARAIVRVSANRRSTSTAVIAAAAFLAGCAVERAGQDHQAYSHVATWPITPVLMTVPDRPDAGEATAGALPVQRLPLRRLQRETDDPAEPYSPNHGPIPYKPPQQPRTPEPQDVSFRTEVRVAPQWTAADEERVIARALGDHERRYP